MTDNVGAESVREAVFRYAREELGTQAEYLFASSPDCAVLRCRDNRKWYGIIMRISRGKLLQGGTGDVDILNVKCDPLLRASLLQKAGFFPAYHMNKTHWITMLLDGSVPMEDLTGCLAMSYDRVSSRGAGRTKGCYDAGGDER